jgi:segregation and condensation protein A
MVANSLAFQVDAGFGPYGIKIDIFEGPLDLLLFLIRKNEIDIYDIPIAEITRQFLAYVEVIQSLNLEQAGDFVLMAATLMKIKSRMLLPSDPEDEEEAGDPREDLVRRLLEYQQFKEVASWMEDQQAACRDRFYRGAALDMVGLEEDALEACRSVGLFDLLAAFKQALAAASKVDFHEVERVEVNTEECAEVILDVLAQKERASFVELVSGLPRIVLIVTFIALLELIRTGQVVARQVDLNSDIWIYKQEAETEAQEAKTPPGSQRDV